MPSPGVQGIESSSGRAVAARLLGGSSSAVHGAVTPKVPVPTGIWGAGQGCAGLLPLPRCGVWAEKE